jgi:hypothetical protein
VPGIASVMTEGALAAKVTLNLSQRSAAFFKRAGLSVERPPSQSLQAMLY